MSRHLVMPERKQRRVQSPCAGHADVLDAWLGSSSRLSEYHQVTRPGSTVNWDAPRCAVALAYDTADQGLPTGVRVVVQEGSRRLMFEAQAYEVLLRVAADQQTRRYELAGQVLYEGLPLPGAAVRLERDGPGTTISTDGAGGFRLPPLVHGAYGLSIAVEGAVLSVPPIALR